MNPKKLMLDVNPLYVFSESSSSSVGQGVHIRVIGVSDSKSLLVPVDVVKEELDDDLLSVVCRLKSAGSPLSTLGALGQSDSFTTNHPDDLWNDYYNLFFLTQVKVNIVCSVVLSQEEKQKQLHNFWVNLQVSL